MPHTTFVATVFPVIPHSHTSMWPLHCVFRAVMPENLHRIHKCIIMHRSPCFSFILVSGPYLERF